ncbi:hypothetical protein HPP92_028019 [Vanilla planifolia]|uniref:Uncharacterized protein n=1 Tax=Vanilla planifolia TaxID=51239 RepID=A0A835U4I8_VANPL|nr:hypothetical protein HPP92_028019 [Vanilla planifolia]
MAPAAATATATNLPLPEQQAIWIRIRLADNRDVSIIHRLIHQMAVFERLTDLFSATESSLNHPLLPLPPLSLIHGPHPRDIPFSHPRRRIDLDFRPIVRQIARSAVDDPEAEASRPREGRAGSGWIRALLPQLLTFMARPACTSRIFCEGGGGRRLGMGRMMLSVVAREAARWVAEGWRGMGAEVLQPWRICRLSGEALRSYAGNEDDRGGRI